MKRTIITTLILAVLSLVLPIALYSGDLAEEERTESESAEPDESFISRLQGEEFDGIYNVKVTVQGQVLELNMEQYLIGVVAAEMPAAFEPEALKAQAVAARTYTLHKLSQPYSEKHPETGVCDDPSCCKAYIDERQLRERWEADYETNLEIITRAVKETDGIILTYEEQPILAAFHSSSPGYTAASAEVWGNELPYLISVESPENEDKVPNYISSTEISREDFTETVLERFPSAQLENDSGWVEIISLTQSGRVNEISLGGVVTTGKVVREMFALRSAAFIAEVTEQAVIFTTAGYGHGVGMSQYGANILAEEGARFDEILEIYYPSTDLTKLTTD